MARRPPAPKRRASAARESPTAPAREATVHGRAGSSCSRARARRTSGVVAAAQPRRGLRRRRPTTPGRPRPRARRGAGRADRPGPVPPATTSAASTSTSEASSAERPGPARSTTVGGSAAEQPGADLARPLVRAHEHGVGAVAGVAPRPHALPHRQLQADAVRRLAATAGVDERLRRRPRPVGHDVRLRSADQHHVAGGRARAPVRPSGWSDAVPPVSANTVSGASSCTRTDQGGAITTRSRNASSARGARTRS